MSDDPREVHPDEGRGRTEEGAASAPPIESAPSEKDGRNGTTKPPPDQAEERSGGSEIPIGTPMTAEQWRQAKEQAERADSED